jgi:hypothetical protein
MHTSPISTLIAGTLLLLGCHSPAPTPGTPVTDACAVLTPAEISAVLGHPLDPGRHIPASSTIMCAWPKTGVPGEPAVVLNFTTPEYFQKEREPHPRITTTPAPGIADDAYYITSEFGTSLFIKKGNTVIGFSIHDRTIPSADLMAKEKALGLKAATRI